MMIFGGSLKNPVFRGEFTKNIYIGGLPKKRWLGQFADLRGAWQERGECCFWGGWVYIPMYTTSVFVRYIQYSLKSLAFRLKQENIQLALTLPIVVLVAQFAKKTWLSFLTMGLKDSLKHIPKMLQTIMKVEVQVLQNHHWNTTSVRRLKVIKISHETCAQHGSCGRITQLQIRESQLGTM